VLLALSWGWRYRVVNVVRVVRLGLNWARQRCCVQLSLGDGRQGVGGVGIHPRGVLKSQRCELVLQMLVLVSISIRDRGM
jgi:hypothetical protein